MEIDLSKTPKDVTIISGFPGFGMVGTIATEYLIEHLDTEHVGRITLESMPAVIAIHEGTIVEPLSLFHDKKHNLLIIHSIFGQPGTEWKVAKGILEVAKKVQAKEIISLEGVGTNEEADQSNAFYLTTGVEKKLKDIKLKRLNEGIIMGVTSALLMKAGDIPITCLFAEASAGMPDSKAAATIIESLDKYLELGVDTKPLLEMAEKFETKLKKILQESRMAETQRDKKQLSYVG